MAVRFESYLSGQEHKCPVCGKTFYATSEWVYRKKGKVFCSWKCRRTVDNGKRPEPETISEKIKRAMQDGLNDGEIRRLMGVTQKQIDMAFLAREGRKKNG